MHSSVAKNAVQALRAWLDCCDASARPQVERMLKDASALADKALVAQVHARALKHGHRATLTAWTDVADPDRLAGKIFSSVGSCDTHLLSKPAGAFVEMEPTLGSAQIAVNIPLNCIALYGGQSLQDYLLDRMSVMRIPRTATVKTKACLVYSDAAEVMLRVHAYHGVQMTTYTFLPSGNWDSVGIREGSGLLGMGHADGQMKAFCFQPAIASDMVVVGDDFGPQGAGLTSARDDVIMTVTLFRKPAGLPAHMPTYESAAPVYRSLGAAMVTASDNDIGAEVAAPDLAGDDVDGIVVEIFFCKVITGREASDEDTDNMCREVLRAQVGIGSKAPDATAALDRLDGKSYCAQGHGPYAHKSACPECSALCVCH